MNNFGYIWSRMQQRLNFHFFAERVKKPDRAYFDFSEHTAKWSEDFHVEAEKDRDGYDYFEIMIDLELSGKICEYNAKGLTFFQELITLDFGIRAQVTADGWVNTEHVFLLNDEQRALNHFHAKYIQELRRTGHKTLAEVDHLGEEAFSFFGRAWKNVDNENSRLVKGTSLDYFHEFVEAHRNVLFHVSCANMWRRYTSHYADHAYKFQATTVYPMNPSFYDTRYTIFLESAMEDLYTFYERCAYFTYLFLQPSVLRPKDLSFAKLFDKRVTKSMKGLRPDLATNPYWLWFSSRVNKEHKTLSGFRHPLIHYQDTNTFIRGSYAAAQSRLWLNNAMDDSKGLDELFGKMDDILKFLNQELPKCHEAYVNVVQLCESLIPVTVTELNFFQRTIKIFRGWLADFGRKLVKIANENGN